MSLTKSHFKAIASILNDVKDEIHHRSMKTSWKISQFISQLKMKCLIKQNLKPLAVLMS